MKFPFKTIVNSEDETRLIAEKFAEKIKSGDIIALSGNLGTGKTFFVKSIAQCFDISNVTSPTFAIVNTYNGKLKINHFDISNFPLRRPTSAIRFSRMFIVLIQIRVVPSGFGLRSLLQ